MEEINKKTLIESLSSLPEHEPPANLWKEIESAMEEDSSLDLSRQRLRDLPVYDPPTDLWESIENKISNKGRLIPLKSRKAWSIAASLAFVIAAIWSFNQLSRVGNMDQTSDFTVSYSTELADDQLFVHDWNEDEAAFEEFKLLCEAKKYICEHPEFQVLKTDLDELTEAKEAIQEVIGDYGTDPDLVIQIKEIELERTDILKKMMVMLI